MTTSALAVWLVEAAEMRDPEDPDQGLVFLHLDHNIKLFGHVSVVDADLLVLEVVTEIRNGEPRGIDYQLRIPLSRIILARYADLTDTDLPKENFR